MLAPGGTLWPFVEIVPIVPTLPNLLHLRVLQPVEGISVRPLSRRSKEPQRLDLGSHHAMPA